MVQFYQKVDDMRAISRTFADVIKDISQVQFSSRKTSDQNSLQEFKISWGHFSKFRLVYF